MAQALHIADRYLLDRIVVNQPQYNMFHRYIEKEIIPFGEKNGISQIVFSPLAQGCTHRQVQTRWQHSTGQPRSRSQLQHVI